ncbi:hypothetical protein CB0940_04082 [Cercospora beticola]|uniref:BZIP domain-containing protein n=1 Tax=Cercospora beticola TaxID=122368 RepID=A0A2G5HL85_CERBT|nr:hypothetical protein CB0940_04082 [Cercospora beticola]PIA93309.1 hypothetical protein CB0940_04082 [Cercospora beticola]WPB01295.1 hypothetical protein RHO25_005919 [Cercospora beticola]
MENRPRGRPRQRSPPGSTPSAKIQKSGPSNSTNVASTKRDDSAAERRRAQVRVAQRAYRQKQESTLQNLRRREAELTETMKLMKKSFTDHRDRLIRSNLPDDQLQDVQETALKIESFMDLIRDPGQSSSQKAVGRKGQRKTAKPAADESTLEPKHWDAHPSSWGGPLSIHGHSPTRDHVPGLESASTSTPAASKDPVQSDQHESNVHRKTLIQQPRPPRTYSFAETTFARRLHRATAEQAYKLLHEFDKRPTTYKRSFRLSLMSRDRETLIKMTREMLARGPREPLDQETALIHVGGAGTHYPKRDASGRLLPKPQTWHVGIVGPHRLALLEDAVKGKITVNMTVDIAGLEGEWFDPYDVEGYLAEKGIYIDPLASFAVAEIAVPSVVPRDMSGPGFSSSGAGQSSANVATLPFLHQLSLPRLFGEEEQRQDSTGASIDATSGQASTLPTVGFSDAASGSWMNLIPSSQANTTQTAAESQTRAPEKATTGGKTTDFPTVGFSDAASGSWVNFMPSTRTTTEQTPITSRPRASHETSTPGRLPSLQDYLQATTDASAWDNNETMHEHSRQTKRIMIDVSKFIHFLMVFSVCLCRTPGFNRFDVDRALELSSVDAY